MLTPSCLTLCDPLDGSPPGSPVHGILQARILEWVAMPSSRGSSSPRDGTHISCISSIGRQILCYCDTWEAQRSPWSRCLSLSLSWQSSEYRKIQAVMSSGCFGLHLCPSPESPGGDICVLVSAQICIDCPSAHDAAAIRTDGSRS